MNKQSFITILLTLLMSMTGEKAFADYIVVANSDGVNISYTIMNDKKELEVSRDYWYSGDIVIPEFVEYQGETYTVKSIGYDAFGGTKVTSIKIPNSVTSIAHGAFSNSTWYSNQPDGCLYLDNWLIGYKGNELKGDLIIEEGTRGIADKAFERCTGLTSVTIPNSVTSIGESVFSYCSGLTSVTISNNVTSIGELLFYFCTSLTSIYIPDRITEIGRCAFYGCSRLKSITLPNSLKSIGQDAFYNCTSMNSIIIPSSVTSIGENAFFACEGLTTITIPSSVKSIGKGAFYNCNNLSSISVEKDNLFYDSRDNCNAIIESSTNMLIAGCINTKMPQTLKTIGDYAFSGCIGLTSISIPDGVTEIGGSAFGNCTGLTSVTLPKSLTTISYYAFSGCTNLTSIEIPNRVETIYSGAFRDCSSLTSFIIPNSVTAFGEAVLSGCSSLTSLTIGSNVTSIKDLWGIPAFDGCNKILTVKSYILEPFSFDKMNFPEEVYRNATLYIPKGTEKLYSRFDGWREFLKIVEMDEDDVPDNIADTRKDAIFVQCFDGTISIKGIKEGIEISVYSISGLMIGSAKAQGDCISITTNLKSGDVAIVRIGKTFIKVVMQ